MRVGRIIAGALMAAALLAGPGFAQIVPAPHARELADALEAQTAALILQDYALAAGPVTGEAAQGGPARIRVRLWAGQDYVLAGVCDARCDGVALRLIDPLGQVTAARASTQHGIYVTPAITGQHVIEVRTLQRRSATCWFAVNVYAR